MTVSPAAVVGSKETKKKTPQPQPPPPKVFEDREPLGGGGPGGGSATGPHRSGFRDGNRPDAPRKDGEDTDGAALSVADVTHSYMVLDSPILNGTDEPFGDLYGPVRFIHLNHAADVGGCAACHQKPFNPDTPDRVSLKAAYHQQCMGCHEEAEAGAGGLRRLP